MTLVSLLLLVSVAMGCALSFVAVTSEQRAEFVCRLKPSAHEIARRGVGRAG
jgi:hypothetical protein